SKSEFIIKKSKFIGLLKSVNTEQEAFDFLRSVKTEYPDATHHCFAFSIGSGARKISRSNDDGEPLNSAGKPILSAIESSDLNNVICVVVRYFGGIKLGVGGLIRAYGQTARECIQKAERVVNVSSTDLHIQTSYKHIGAVMNLVNRLKGKVINVQQGENVLAVINIRNSMISVLKEQLKSISVDILIN
ncbi:TPA: YigZ family protein, partial [Candidatus Poribacteria bacterium]|nr:YigZ family protein [Candidatus Poribacteria bacterium]